MKLFNSRLPSYLVLQTCLSAATHALRIPPTNEIRDDSLVDDIKVCADNITRMPDGAWDTHLHIVDPTRYPLSPDATYTTGVYTVWDNAQFEKRISGDHVVIIQPSIYGNDNTALLQALMAYGPGRARAAVVFDTDNITTTQLEEWHTLGVRGVRINISTAGDPITTEELSKILKAYADIIRPLGWSLEVYIPMATIATIEDLVPTLGVPVVFDHFGNPSMPEPSGDPESLDPYTLDGFSALVRLLKQGKTWVKISGAYRLSKLDGPEWRDLDPVAKELFRVAEKKLVFASDWPHTKFEGLDIKPWVEHLLDLTEGNELLRQRLFRDNARVLYGDKGNCSRRAML